MCTLNEVATKLNKLIAKGHGDKEIVIGIDRGDNVFCEDITSLKLENIGESDMYGETVITASIDKEDRKEDISNNRKAIVLYGLV